MNGFILLGFKPAILCSRCGPLIDLCRGPHVRHTGKIKALKIHKVRIPVSSDSKSAVLISAALISAVSQIPQLLFLQLPRVPLSGDFTAPQEI